MILSEDCLIMIFKILGPKEWVVISQVCLKWKNAVSRLWNRIGRIRLDRYHDRGKFPSMSPIILDTLQSEEIIQIIDNLKKVKLLYLMNFQEIDNGKCCIIMFNSFAYQVQNNSVDMEDIIERIFQSLISKKSIKQLKMITLNTKKINIDIIHENLESLRLSKVSVHNIGTFISKLAQLKKLQEFDFYGGNVHQNKIFYTVGTKSLKLEKLYVRPGDDYRTAKYALKSFQNLKNLRCLVILDSLLVLSDDIVSRLVSSCTKLETFELESVKRLSNRSWRKLLSLPNLKCITLADVGGIKTLNFTAPALQLTSILIHYSIPKNLDLTSISNVIHLMPQLTSLMISFQVDEETMLAVLEKIVAYVTSQGRRVVINYNKNKELFITSKAKQSTLRHQKEKIPELRLEIFNDAEVNIESLFESMDICVAYIDDEI